MLHVDKADELFRRSLRDFVDLFRFKIVVGIDVRRVVLGALERLYPACGFTGGVTGEGCW